MKATQYTPEQRNRLARIRLAYRRDLEREHDLTVMEVIVGRDEMDRITVEALRDMGDMLNQAVDYSPHPSSGLASGVELQADIDALRAEGVI